jgi:hypothetical protein
LTEHYLDELHGHSVAPTDFALPSLGVLDGTGVIVNNPPALWKALPH